MQNSNFTLRQIYLFPYKVYILKYKKTQQLFTGLKFFVLFMHFTSEQKNIDKIGKNTVFFEL